MLTQCSTSLLKNFGRAPDESFSRDETQRVISYEVSFHKYLTIFHGRNKMSVIQKALVQLNLNLTVPKSSRSHFSFVQKYFRIFLIGTQFWVVYVLICFPKYFENEKFIPFVTNRYLITTLALRGPFLYIGHCPLCGEVQLY